MVQVIFQPVSHGRKSNKCVLCSSHTESAKSQMSDVLLCLCQSTKELVELFFDRIRHSVSVKCTKIIMKFIQSVVCYSLQLYSQAQYFDPCKDIVHQWFSATSPVQVTGNGMVFGKIVGFFVQSAGVYKNTSYSQVGHAPYICLQGCYIHGLYETFADTKDFNTLHLR